MFLSVALQQRNTGRFATGVQQDVLIQSRLFTKACTGVSAPDMSVLKLCAQPLQSGVCLVRKWCLCKRGFEATGTVIVLIAS